MSSAVAPVVVPGPGFCARVPMGPCRRSVAAQPKVYFFLDFSNIAISASHIAADHGDSLFDGRRVRLHAQNLRWFVERNRVWGRGYAAAGLGAQPGPIKHRFAQAGIQFDVCERGQITGREQNVDERIQLEMYRLPLPTEDDPATVVLATGDGKGFERGSGFIQALKDLRSRKFEIEVMSWRHSFNEMLWHWASHNGRAIELDDYYPDLTFVKGGRCATAKHELGGKLARRLAA